MCGEAVPEGVARCCLPLRPRESLVGERFCGDGVGAIAPSRNPQAVTPSAPECRPPPNPPRPPQNPLHPPRAPRPTATAHCTLTTDDQRLSSSARAPFRVPRLRVTAPRRAAPHRRVQARFRADKNQKPQQLEATGVSVTTTASFRSPPSPYALLRRLRSRPFASRRLDARGERDSHRVEGAPHEDQHDDAEDSGECVSRVFREAFREFDGE